MKFRVGMRCFGGRTCRSFFCLLLGLFLVDFSALQAYGAQVEVAFDTHADNATVHYFMLYWDTASRQSERTYADAIQIDARECLEISGTSFSCTFDLPLQEGETYYFSLRNFYFNAEPSGFANEFMLSYVPAVGVEVVPDVDQDGDIDGIDLAAFAAQSATGTPLAVWDFAALFGAGG